MLDIRKNNEGLKTAIGAAMIIGTALTFAAMVISLPNYNLFKI